MKCHRREHLGPGLALEDAFEPRADQLDEAFGQQLLPVWRSAALDHRAEPAHDFLLEKRVPRSERRAAKEW